MHLIFLKFLIGLILLASWALPSQAWGPNGHRIVGQIAENHLTDKARWAVARLIGNSTLAQISTWADEIKSDASWRHASPWHYINVPENQDLENARRSSRGDVVEAIYRFQQVLKDPGSDRTQRVIALKFLIHFVADVHQPLHVGYARDRGGNDIKVNWFGAVTNLHAVWDENLVEFQRLSFTEWVRFHGQAAQPEIEAWQQSTVEDWARESRLMLPAVYDFGDIGSVEIPFLGYSYNDRHIGGVRLRLLQAGIRLSGMLNELFAEP